MNQKDINQYSGEGHAGSSQLGLARPETRKKLTLKRLAAATVALGFSLALMFGGATASQATSASSGAPAVNAAVAASTSDAVARGPIVWNVYDGSEITTSRNCESRMYYLMDIYSWDPTVHFMCQKYTAGTGYTYWMVWIGYTQ